MSMYEVKVVQKHDSSFGYPIEEKIVGEFCLFATATSFANMVLQGFKDTTVSISVKPECDAVKEKGEE